MGNEQFIRDVAVTIGPPGQKGRTWTDQQVVFHTYKYGSSTPNHGTIALTNLAAESRAYIKKGMAIVLDAGYVGNRKRVYSGDVTIFDHEHTGPEWITRIESKDGRRPYRGLYLSESFGPKTTDETVVRAIARDLGVTIGTLKGLGKVMYDHGRALIGPAAAELDAICRSKGLRWSIQDGALQVLPIGLDTGEPAILLNASTGLVGSPKQTEKGVECTALLQGGVNPGRILKIESRSISGFFIAENVEAEGDTHGQPWYSHFLAIPPN